MIYIKTAKKRFYQLKEVYDAFKTGIIIYSHSEVTVLELTALKKDSKHLEF